MSAAVALWRRELAALALTPLGPIVAAAMLLVDGLLFNVLALGEPRPSSVVLETFFYCASGTTMIACVFVSMRLLVEERHSGTWVLTAGAPLSEAAVVLAKFLAAWAAVAAINLATLTMPLLVLLFGKVSLGHILAGYLGLMLLASACLGLGLLASALATSQLDAAALAATMVTGLLLLWRLAAIADPPMSRVIAYLSLHDQHFRPFMRGIVGSADIVFYLSLTYLALTAATRALAARRWG